MATDGDAIKIGVMTCGGDCPGLNPVVRAVTVAACARGWEVLGIEDSMQGLIDLNYRSPYGNRWLTPDMVDDLVTKGGSILGCDNRSHPFRFAVQKDDGSVVEEDVSDQVVANFKKLGLHALVIIGGDGSMAIGMQLSKKGIPMVGIPKTIDNDLAATDQTFGFDTAVQTIVEAVDKVRDTARSHDRVMVVEVMGRDAGWLALHSGIAAGAEIVLIPEIPYDIRKVAEKVRQRKAIGHPFCIAVVAEGAKPAGGDGSFLGEREAGAMRRYGGVGQMVAGELKTQITLDTRVSVLGYIQRGGSPSNFDRILGSRLGVHAVKMIEEGKFSRMASLRGTTITDVSLEDATEGQRLVDPSGELVQCAKELGVCFGQ
eukprot:TRINITY_DN4511_c0_g2_i1.p1 TRINITY_DN4511_c0_g2~~TRINITY_DN4511_c0_g2_i1.p1  ORF type:complete len:397 (+),score=106.69 TRINITY_DN4511_c0_g2_i1:77-1192(+)